MMPLVCICSNRCCYFVYILLNKIDSDSDSDSDSLEVVLYGTLTVMSRFSGNFKLERNSVTTKSSITYICLKVSPCNLCGTACKIAYIKPCDAGPVYIRINL